MVDRIKQKYAKPNKGIFNDRIISDFRDPPIIVNKNCNKSCLLVLGIFTIVNSTYFITLMYLFNEFQKYTHNKLFEDPNKFNEYLNNITV